MYITIDFVQVVQFQTQLKVLSKCLNFAQVGNKKFFPQIEHCVKWQQQTGVLKMAMSN